MMGITFFLAIYAYTSSKKAVHSCAKGFTSAWELWNCTDEIAAPVIYSVIIAAIILTIAGFNSFSINTTYWPGVVMSIFATPIVFSSGGYLAMRQVIKQNK